MIEQKNGESIIEYELPNFIKDNNDAGDSSDDYVIMQVLGVGGFSEVLKVRSKKNFGIYAMKKVNLVKFFKKYPDPEFQKYYENEILLLQNLDHPNIIKCYNIFKEDHYLFFIMEFMNNGDLESYYKAIKSLNLDIPEDKLWDIYYKCLCGLDYIHKRNVIHRDIKLPNLFLDDKLNVKIGDFNVSAVTTEEEAKKFTDDKSQAQNLKLGYTILGTFGYQAPELLRNLKYGKPVDIYAMGITFYQLCYGRHPNDNKKDLRIAPEDIKNFINKMIDKNPKKRPTSNEALMEAKKYFIKTYVKNTSIESAFNCFNNFENLVQFFSDNAAVNIIFNVGKEISKKVFSLIQSMKTNNIEQIQSELYDLRKSLENEGLDIKSDNIEISLGNFLTYFLRKLNTELNEINLLQNNKKVSDQEKIRRCKILSKNYDFSPNTEEENFIKIINTYNKKILSLISRNFFSFVKITRTCYQCGTSRCSFSKLYFIPINVNIMTKRFGNYHDINLKNAFDCLKETVVNIDTQKGKVCKQCNTKSIFKETKNFYHSAKNLIFIFDRGENFENKAFINFDENLILTKSEVERYNQVNYQLIGMISYVKGEYISFVNKNNIWISSKGKQINFYEAKKYGLVVALFYYSTDDILILESTEELVDNGIMDDNLNNINNIDNFVSNNTNHLSNNNQELYFGQTFNINNNISQKNVQKNNGMNDINQPFHLNNGQNISGGQINNNSQFYNINQFNNNNGQFKNNNGQVNNNDPFNNYNNQFNNNNGQSNNNGQLNNYNSQFNNYNGISNNNGQLNNNGQFNNNKFQFTNNQNFNNNGQFNNNYSFNNYESFNNNNGQFTNNGQFINNNNYQFINNNNNQFNNNNKLNNNGQFNNNKFNNNNGQFNNNTLNNSSGLINYDGQLCNNGQKIYNNNNSNNNLNNNRMNNNGTIQNNPVNINNNQFNNNNETFRNKFLNSKNMMKLSKNFDI